jgi:hypothetical protein
MKGIQGSNRLRKELQGTRQYGRSKFHQRQAAEQRADFVSVRSRQLARVNPSPNLILNQPAGDQRLAPESGRRAIFRQKMRQRDRISR